MTDIKSIIAKKSVIILVGAGGVGKTTTSIALAMLAAKAGKRVGLISIDPAKRLAAAMGISLAGELRPVALPKDFTGSLSAAMLDQQGVFDSMVDRFAPNRVSAQNIKAHSFYKACSQNLAGALEFMALAKLQEMVESDAFDLVVVDTPPDAHALDFLARPDSLARFVDSKVTTWMLKPFAASKKLGLNFLLSKGEKLMGGIAKVAGLSALQTMSEFLVMLQDVMAGFNRAGAKVSKTIRSNACAFVLVTAPRAAPIRASLNMLEQLQQMKLQLNIVVVNRCMPQKLRDELADANVADLDPALASLQRRRLAELKAINVLMSEAKEHFPQLHQNLVGEIEGSVDNLHSVWRIAEQLQ